jgi:hypothetical protein
MIKAQRVNDIFYLMYICGSKALGIRKAMKKLFRYNIDLIIRGLSTENHGYKKLKAIVIMQKRASVRPYRNKTNV